MTPDTFLATVRDADVMLPLLGSLAAGCLIGAEREFQGKPAGLRTHALVCFASAILTLTGLRMDEWTVALPAGTEVVSDMARMPHAIMTGIGFLGAGVIFREGVTVQGLTTAASLWLTAALGVVFGAGLIELATVGTVIAFVVLALLRAIQRLAPAKPAVRVELTVQRGSTYDTAKLETLLLGMGLRPGPISIHKDRPSGLRNYALIASTQNHRLSCEAVVEALEADETVQNVSIVPLENDVAVGGK